MVYGGSPLILGSPTTGAISIACDPEFKSVWYLSNMCHQICSLHISLLIANQGTWYALSMYLQLDADCNDSLAYAWGSLYMYTVLYIYPFGPWNMDLVVRSSSPNMVVKQAKVKRHKV